MLVESQSPTLLYWIPLKRFHFPTRQIPWAVPDDNQGRCDPERNDERPKRNWMFVDQRLAQREPGVRGPRDRKTSAGSVIEPCHHDGVCKLICPPGRKASGEKFAEMAARGRQNGPIMPDRPDRAYHETSPKCADAPLELRLSVTAPAEFLTPRPEQKTARRKEGGENQCVCVAPPDTAVITSAMNPSSEGPRRAITNHTGPTAHLRNCWSNSRTPERPD